MKITKKIKKAILWVFFVLVNNILFCQNEIFTGYVLDIVTYQALIGANIIKSDNTGTSTDRNGFFSLKLNDDDRYIIISYVGYKQDTVFISENIKYPITIGIQNVRQDEIVVLGKKPLSGYFGRENLTIEEIQRTPTLLGEKDVIKSLALLSGVSPGSEISSEIFVRGGNGDQNMTLLDGGNIFASNHLFGFISPFNPYAIKSVDLYKGGFQVEYGGRLSSIIDMTLDGGSFSRKEGALTVGLLNSYFKFSQPILKDKMSIAVTGRVAYPLTLFSALTKDQDGIENNYYLYDGSIKVNFKPNSRSRISLSLYNNQDYFSIITTNDNSIHKSKTNWGNLNASLNYFTFFKNGLSLKSNLNFSNYAFKGAFLNLKNNELENQINVLNKLNEYSWKSQIDHSPKSWLELKAGFDVSYFHLKPNTTEIIDYRDDDTSITEPLYNSIDLAAYGNVLLKPFSKLSIDLGARVQKFKTLNYQSNINIQPRVKFNFNLYKNTVLNLSYSKMSQPIQRVTNTSSYIPNDIWLPPIENLTPSLSNQFSIGLTSKFKGLEFVVEGYIKYMSDLVQIVPNNFILVPDLTNLNSLATNGVGNAKGIEMSIAKKLGKFYGNIGYTLSKSERKFDAINNGRTFPFKFDRRHDFEVLLNYDLGKKWSINSAFVYSSGYHFTTPDKILLHPNRQNDKNIIELARSINNTQLRPYNRLDLSLNKEYNNRFGKDVKWSFGVYNVYGYKNPLYINTKKKLRHRIENGSFIYDHTIISQKAISPLRWIPSINYSIKF